MARRYRALKTSLKFSAMWHRYSYIVPLMTGGVVTAFIMSVAILSLWQLWQFGGDFGWSESLASILRFSLWQAALSTLLSLALGVPLGRAYVRRSHIWVRRLSWLFSMSFLLPVIVVVFAFIEVHGSRGWVNSLADSVVEGAGGGRYIYGLGGIVAAHVFFNAPLAARLIAQALQTIPTQHWRLAEQLGLLQLSAWRRFMLIEYPHIKPILWGAAALIFLLCFTSFAIVLILGSGLFASLEVAIYYALRLQFEPTQAAFLALVQIAVCLGLVSLLSVFGRPTLIAPQAEDVHRGVRPDSHLKWARINDAVVLSIAALLILPILAAVPLALADISAWQIFTSASFAKALGGSLLIAPIAALVSTSAACALGCAARRAKLQYLWHKRATLFELPGVLVLIIPPLTLSAGLFLLFHRLGFAGNFYVSLGLVIIINGLLALPFALHILAPSLYKIAEQNDRAADGLGLRGFRRWRLVELPLLRRPLGLALGLSAALSVGDVSAIALFGTQDFSNLPLLLYRLLGSYRFAEAGGVGVALCVLVGGLFWAGHALVRAITKNTHGVIYAGS